MKVYNKLVIDIASGQVLESQAFEYTGDVAETKGSSPSSSSTQQTSTQANPTTNALSNLGAQYLAPSFGSQFLGRGGKNNEKPKFSLPTGSFPSMSGTVEQTWGRLQNDLPLFSQGFQETSKVPSNIAGLQIGSAAPTMQVAANYAANELNRGPLPFDELAARQISALRPGFAARGTVPSGGAQAAEEEALRNLNVDLATKDAEARNRAIGTLGNIGTQQQQIYSNDFQNELAKQAGVLSSTAANQQLISQGYQLPLNILQTAGEVESLPVKLLTGLAAAASGGTSVTNTTGKTSTSGGGGSGIFGK